MMNLNELFKNTSYDDTLFSENAIASIETAIFMKSIKTRKFLISSVLPGARKLNLRRKKQYDNCTFTN